MEEKIRKHVMKDKKTQTRKVVGGSIMIGFPLVIAVPEQDMPGIEPGPLSWHANPLTNELQEGDIKTWSRR
jgi:hypothetical protein